MHKHHSSLGPSQHPFPGARSTEAERAEDAFMQKHGGFGSTLIYRIVQLVFIPGRGR